MAIACVALGLALPAAASADPSAQNQYTPPNVSATGSGHDRGNPSGAVSPAGSGGSGSAVLPILLSAVVVIGGAGAVILYRRRRSDPTSPE
ncbi:MAG: hypothetical protein ACRDMH_03985 [Solirubrobacterales bacterium]